MKHPSQGDRYIKINNFSIQFMLCKKTSKFQMTPYTYTCQIKKTQCIALKEMQQ